MTFLKLIDNQNRFLNYLRISITDRCNLRCVYCKPTNRTVKLNHNDILSYEEIIRLSKIAVSLGIKKVRITGGEPLTRKGIIKFIDQLANINGIIDLSLTTNGILLFKNAEKIKNAGINRINVSLDSLYSSKYKLITGHDKFKTVWKGLIKAYELGFSPIKINIVAIGSLNEKEIFDFARLTFFYPFHIRFIEYMPIGMSSVRLENRILTPKIKRKLSIIGNLIRIKNKDNDGPARRFRFEKALGEIGFISALSQHFCYTCNRLRLTADGELRSCLLSNNSISLRKLIREDCSDRQIVQAFFTSAKFKGLRHQVLQNEKKIIKGSMYSIGG